MSFTKSTVAFFALAACHTGFAAQPNIVYILADDMGLGDVSAFNLASHVQTPEIDRMANAGMSFNDAHTNSSVCTPTRYGILTGRYAWRTRLTNGVLDGMSPHLIETTRMTVASMLKQQGYRTACIGKWHLGVDWVNTNDWSRGFTNGPMSVGFDYFFGISASLDMNEYAYLEGNGVVQAPTGTIAASPWPAFWRAGKISPNFRHVDVLPNLTDTAVSFIRQHHSASPQTPFFLYLPLTSPHTPHVPTASFVGTTTAGTRGDFVAATDWSVGRILKILDSLGLSANTIVFFTSDNGAHDQTYQANGHTPHLNFKGQKADIYEAGHRVPFIVKWSGVVAAGTTSNRIECHTDLLATVAAITGFRLPDSAGEDSYSLLPALLNRNMAGSNRTSECTIHHSLNGTFAVRRGRWKLTLDNMGSGGFTNPVTSAGLGTLYDLTANPGENAAMNRYATFPDTVIALRSCLTKFRADGRSVPLPRTDEFYVAPVPTFPVQPGKARLSRGHAQTILVYGLDGTMVREYSPTSAVSSWNGKDGRGNQVPHGIYFTRTCNQGDCMTEKVWVVK